MVATAIVEPYLVMCRHCGEPIGIRLRNGKLKVFDAFDIDRNRVNVTCPECKRMTKVPAHLGVEPNRP